MSDILEANYHAACMLLAPPGADGALPRVPQSDCARILPTLKAFHGAWKKSVVSMPPTVRVTGAASRGTTATVTDTEVIVDGYTLNRLELIGATSGASMSLHFALTKHNGGWYVSNMNFGFG